ncbi:MAG: 3-oxoacyl-[acyl-carrier protein] reductase [uncultured Rubrobacteraceae bacterium]|uniref:3-oxoacyl-[acyl-carrier protein] reductase n=1 Tax=uncultured Rubrobacteraceae bacterium TaxID=349277 RepID=A0A6J4QI63_9ACTN|nr:MAG: 3-oxoacyl-[acyl-carrier protein] reductase [uncultured Rubrobacteraceae bacterium]
MGILEGKVALVTGASRGVGAAISGSLAEEGAAVVVNYRKSEERAEEVARGIRGSGGEALPYRADITDEAAVRRMVRAAEGTFGAVDILVNNALPDYNFDPVGRKDFAGVQWGDYLQQLGALRGALYCSQAVVPGMIGKGGGRIVSILSNLINNPVVAYHDYTTAKSSFLGFSRNLAAELGPHNITVNMIAGGLVDETDASAATTQEVRDIVAGSTPLRRLGTPEDLGRAVLMFASPWADFVTGQYITCDGGMVMP